MTLKINTLLLKAKNKHEIHVIYYLKILIFFDEFLCEKHYNIFCKQRSQSFDKITGTYTVGIKICVTPYNKRSFSANL